MHNCSVNTAAFLPCKHKENAFGARIAVWPVLPVIPATVKQHLLLTVGSLTPGNVSAFDGRTDEDENQVISFPYAKTASKTLCCPLPLEHWIDCRTLWLREIPAVHPYG